MKVVRFNSSLTIGALAALDVVSGSVLATSDSKYRLLSMRFTPVWQNIVGSADGGMMFGIAHGDYTAAEIEECIEATTSISPGDKIANEKANRMVRILGTIVNDGGGVPGQDSSFNQGRMTKVKLNWPIQIGKTVTQWVYNNSGTVWATGSFLSIQGTVVVAYS